MEQVQQIRPISDFRLHHSEVLEEMDRKPVVLVQRGRPRAVLVNIEHWNKLIQLLEEKDDIIDVLEAELALATGADELLDVTEDDLAELKAMAMGHEIPAA